MRVIHLIGVAAALLPTLAGAAETITYRYDAKGRLTQTERGGTTNGGVVTAYAFDRADNRTSVTVSGSPYSTPPQRVIVLPLQGPTPVTISGP